MFSPWIFSLDSHILYYVTLAGNFPHFAVRSFIDLSTQLHDIIKIYVIYIVNFPARECYSAPRSGMMSLLVTEKL